MQTKKTKTVLITGTGSGLGKEAAIALARRGHRVLSTVLYESQIQELETIKIEENLNIEIFKLDVRIEEDRKKILSYLPIDVFIVNSAIGDSGSVCDVSIRRIRDVFETNIFSNLEMVQLVLKPMIEQQKMGRIVFLSSMAGRIPAPFLSPYCASKSAIESFATCLRLEMKYLKDSNIEVAVIEPGAYATGFNKENNSKKYTWMKDTSYFKSQVKDLKKIEVPVWNFLEQKPYTSIIHKYIQVVETKHLKHRYYSPWWQAFFVQLGRIFGM